VPLNPNLLRIAVAKQAEKTLVKEIRPLVKLDFEEKKKQFFEAFDSDPVSQEIAAGPDAFSNVSELAEVGGNLFTFLGFLKSQSPIAGLRGYLQDNIVLYKTKAGKVSGNKIVFETQFVSPTEAEINSVMAKSSDTKLHWGSNRSFTDILAKGVPGLPRFLTDKFPSPEPSRSGGGIQVTNELRKGSSEKTPKIPYIKNLLSVLNRIVNRKR
jgi:hypothetical protein